MKDKKNTWVKIRHKIIRPFLALYLAPSSRLLYGNRIEKFPQQKDRPFLILMNHQTAYDQFFVSMSCPRPVYYVASEDLFSAGFASKLMRWAVAPIPIKKQVTDVAAVKTCIRVAREGGTIGMAPEGNRTYSGKTEYMNPAIVPLIRKLKLPVAFYRIEGGYGIQPRWSDVIRKGKMRSYVSEILEPEDYSNMSDQELLEKIQSALYVNEGTEDRLYLHKKRAEYLERALYVCPFCGLSRFESNKEKIRCTKCGREVEYGNHKKLTGLGFSFPFPFVNDWYEYQQDFVRKLDLTPYKETPMYEDRAQLSEVILQKRKNLLNKNAEVLLYGDRLVLRGETMTFDEISAIVVLGKNKLNIYYKDKLYQLKGDKRFNALKYVNMFHHYGNMQKGDLHGEFLGL